MRRLYRIFWLPFYRRWALSQMRRAGVYRYADLVLSIPPGVFHPGIFFSTPIFLNFLQQIDFQGNKVLDIGTGTGILALFAARKGARVTALDINPLALDTARRNADQNGIGGALLFIQSDLLDAVLPQHFDIILINPPYYQKQPADMAEYAFFAGAALEYFEKLFRQLPAYVDDHTQTWMILSEDCDWDRIASIAAGHGFQLGVLQERKKWGERFWVVGCNRINV